MTYRVGFDVGERSVGCAAVEYDDDGFAIRHLAVASHIHDGGADPNAGQTKESRLASAGLARRTRKLLRRRRARLRELDQILRNAGITRASGRVTHTYDAWRARAILSQELVADPSERSGLLHIAISHIARHRGWRNPWHSYARLKEASTISSENLDRTLDRAAQIMGVPDGTYSTLGQAVAAVVDGHGPSETVRPRKGADSGLLREQVRASDQLSEMNLILATQQVPEETADQICREAFQARMPSVPPERIGHDVLPGMEHLPRANRSLLDFQEFRVRAFVGNLRIREGASKRRLTGDEHHAVVELLLNWRDEEPPRVPDMADVLAVRPSQVNRDRHDRETLAAPVDQTSRTFHKRFSRRHPLGNWWHEASTAERSEWILAVTDPSATVNDDLISIPLKIMSGNDKVMEEVAKFTESLSSGRSSYSRDSLILMLGVMRERDCDEFEARASAFDLDADWSEDPPTLNDPIDHPALQRVNTIIRRFLMGCVQQWGEPDRIVIEHVRNAFLGPTALEKERQIQVYNRRQNEGTKARLVLEGIARPASADIRRDQAIQRQNSTCLYCGSPIGLTTSEMDHIIPDSLGGQNRKDNLVAICRMCNQAKGKQPFVEYCNRTSHPGISLEQAIQRVREWQRSPRERAPQRARLIRDVIRRLSMTSKDIAEEDTRSLESTAYAAVEMRRRIAGSLDIPVSRIDVYRGAITREARRAGGVDKIVALRGALDKSRFDRRHHAIDASVITTLEPLTARTLAERLALADAARIEGSHDHSWKEYTGRTENARHDFAEWKQRIGALAEVIVKAAADDTIAVVRPLRLTSRSSALHSPNPDRLIRKGVNEAWSAAEVDRITDRDAYQEMLGLLQRAPHLQADASRRLRSTADATLSVFPGGGAQLLVREGAAQMTAVHHARIYAWQTKSGYGFGHIRVFSGDLHRLGAGNLTALPLPLDSASMRSADRSLRQLIEDGAAVQIGWLTQNDEIEIDPHHPAFRAGRLGECMTEFPEKRWAVSGFENATRVSIVPSYLALEGTPEPWLAADSPHTTSGQRAMAAILKANRHRIAVSVLFKDPSALVVRRTALGRPRWNSTGLPTCWSPRRAAHQALG